MLKPNLKAILKKKPQPISEKVEVELTFEQVRFLEQNKKHVELEYEHGFTKVLDSYVKRSAGYEIVFDDNTSVKCAKNHRFLIYSNYTRIWKTANEIGHTDLFSGKDGSYKRLKAKKDLPEQEWIDFTVDNEDETYLQNGIIHHNSGKSFSIYMLSRYLLEMEKRILIIVPSVSLVTQLNSDFMKYNWDYDEQPALIFSGQDKYQDKMLTITTWQSVYKMSEEFFSKFDAVLCDEAHGATSISIKSILGKCKKAEYKIGFTGTMHEHESDIMTTVGYIGPVIYELKTKDLIDNKHVSDLTIVNTFVRYTDQDVINCKERSYQSELDYINEDKRRMGVLDIVIKTARPKEENILILCTNKEPLFEVEKYLRDKYGDEFEIKLYHGDVKATNREIIREEMEVTKKCILLGTYGSLSTGVSIKRLHHVVLFSSYRSKIKVLQSIGRGLRLHESKTKMIVWDVIDDLSFVNRNGNVTYNHLMKQWIEDRMRYYKDQGFDTKKFVFMLK